jgi:hypothetical protein
MPSMEELFKPKDKIVKIKHVGVTSRLLSWILKANKVRVYSWMIKSEDHVDFCDYSHRDS